VDVNENPWARMEATPGSIFLAVPNTLICHAPHRRRAARSDPARRPASRSTYGSSLPGRSGHLSRTSDMVANIHDLLTQAETQVWAAWPVSSQEGAQESVHGRCDAAMGSWHVTAWFR